MTGQGAGRVTIPRGSQLARYRSATDVGPQTCCGANAVLVAGGWVRVPDRRETALFAERFRGFLAGSGILRARCVYA
jgi:hypothetical protein